MLDKIIKVVAWQLLVAFCVVYVGGVLASTSVLLSLTILLVALAIGLILTIKNG